jgi:dihydroceramidase
MSFQQDDTSTAAWFTVASRTHDATGYWGPPNANHQFCEPHYDVTQYVAEFYNTVSSLGYTVVAAYMLVQEPKLRHDPYVLAAIVTLGTIGLGSAAFHATMRYHMQLCDELPMVFYICCLLLGSISRPNRHPWVPHAAAASLWRAATISTGLAVAACYLVFDLYEIFLHGFTAIIFVQIAVNLVAPLHKTMVEQQLYCRNMSILLILVGRIFWEIEGRMCAQVPQVYPLHVLWHACSCGSAYYGAICLYFTRMVGDESKHALTLPNVYGLPPLKSTITKSL